MLGGIRWAAGPPRILSLRGTLRQRHLVVTVRAARCHRCTAELRVRLRGRSLATPLLVAGGTVRGRSAVLPVGTWPYVVVLRDETTGLSAAVQRRIRVR